VSNKACWPAATREFRTSRRATRQHNGCRPDGRWKREVEKRPQTPVGFAGNSRLPRVNLTHCVGQTHSSNALGDSPIELPGNSWRARPGRLARNLTALRRWVRLTFGHDVALGCAFSALRDQASAGAPRTREQTYTDWQTVTVLRLATCATCGLRARELGHA
jgi:hypothetical protein